MLLTRRDGNEFLSGIGGLLILVSGDDDECDRGVNRPCTPDNPHVRRAIWGMMDILLTNKWNGHFSIPLRLHLRPPVFNSRFVEGSDLATACPALGEIYPIVRSGDGRLENKRFEVVTASVVACPILEGASFGEGVNVFLETPSRDIKYGRTFTGRVAETIAKCTWSGNMCHSRPSSWCCFRNEPHRSTQCASLMMAAMFLGVRCGLWNNLSGLPPSSACPALNIQCPVRVRRDTAT